MQQSRHLTRPARLDQKRGRVYNRKEGKPYPPKSSTSHPNRHRHSGDSHGDAGHQCPLEVDVVAGELLGCAREGVVWMLVAMVVAVRQALDYTSTGRAVGVCVMGWLVQDAIFSTLRLFA